MLGKLLKLVAPLLVGWSMDLITELNRSWEGRLGNLERRMWERMKALGVEARWVDPFRGNTPIFTEQVGDNPPQQVPGSEFFDFVVTRNGEVLTQSSKHKADYDAVVIVGLVQAANKLEERGIPVIRD